MSFSCQEKSICNLYKKLCVKRVCNEDLIRNINKPFDWFRTMQLTQYNQNISL